MRRGRMPFRCPHVLSKLSCRCEPELTELAPVGVFHHPVLLLKAIPGSPASMGLADSSRRIRIGDIELAYRITGRGKPVILVHVRPTDVVSPATEVVRSPHDHHLRSARPRPQRCPG